MQGLNDPNRELLDAGAFCRQLVDEGSVYAFLADHRTDVFADGMFEDLFPSRRGRPSWGSPRLPVTWFTRRPGRPSVDGSAVPI